MKIKKILALMVGILFIVSLSFASDYYFPSVISNIESKIDKITSNIKDPIKKDEFLFNLKKKINLYKVKYKLKYRLATNQKEKNKYFKKVLLLTDIEKLIANKLTNPNYKFVVIGNNKKQIINNQLQTSFDSKEAKKILWDIQKSNIAFYLKNSLLYHSWKLSNNDSYFVKNSETKVDYKVDLNSFAKIQWDMSILLSNTYIRTYGRDFSIDGNLKFVTNISTTVEEKSENGKLELYLQFIYIYKDLVNYLKLKNYEIKTTGSFSDKDFEFLKKLKDLSDKYNYLAIKQSNSYDYKKIEEFTRLLSDIEKRLLFIPYKQIDKNTWLLVPSKYFCELVYSIDGNVCKEIDYRKGIKNYFKSGKYIYLKKEKNDYKLFIYDKNNKNQKFELYFDSKWKLKLINIDLKDEISGSKIYFKYNLTNHWVKSDILLKNYDTNFILKLDTIDWKYKGIFSWNINYNLSLWGVIDGLQEKSINIKWKFIKKGYKALDYEFKITLDISKNILKFDLEEKSKQNKVNLFISNDKFEISLHITDRNNILSGNLNYNLDSGKIRWSLDMYSNNKQLWNVLAQWVLRKYKNDLIIKWFFKDIYDISFDIYIKDTKYGDYTKTIVKGNLSVSEMIDIVLDSQSLYQLIPSKPISSVKKFKFINPYQLYY